MSSISQENALPMLLFWSRAATLVPPSPPQELSTVFVSPARFFRAGSHNPLYRPEQTLGRGQGPGPALRYPASAAHRMLKHLKAPN